MKQQVHSKLIPLQGKFAKGFTLIEILVAIIVLSFGLLGMVGIQAMALKSNADAKQQSAAVQLAAELSDMMRGNKAVSVALTPANNPYLIANFVSTDPLPAYTENCGLAACTTPLNVAKWEFNEWLTRVNGSFPGARVQVCYDKVPYSDSGSTKGLTQWGCNSVAAVAGDSISIKIGWTRDSINKTRVQTGNATSDAATNAAAAFDYATSAGSRPSIIYTVTPGSSS